MDGQVEREGRDGTVEPSAEPGIEPKRQRVPGSGRKKGTPNRIAGQIKKDAAAFFRSCTSENVKFRRRLKEFCESGEVLKHSHTLAVLLAHSLGKPVPKTPEQEQKSPLLFITQHDIGKWDPLAEKAAALAARKAARKLPEKSSSAETFTPPAADDPEGLVVVDPGTMAPQVMAPRPVSR